MPLQTVKTPFTNMTFSPDVPSSALSDKEYNSGQNIETDVRSVKSVLGDQYILAPIIGNQIFVTSGFRANDVYWFIVATQQGAWFAIDQAGDITNITPPLGNFSGYSTSTVITASWNGNVLFINDETNPPMFLLPDQNVLYLYDNPPYNYVWNYDVTNNTISGNTQPLYSSLTAGFLRVYNSPNLGSLLVAGNLTGTVASGVLSPTPGTIQNLPTTVRWSQNFGLNAGPTTWAPTAYNVANELEVPVRGPVIDGFSLSGNFYICSYWDTCVMSPIAYQASTAPNFGIKVVSQGRGLINENCWAVVDTVAYGVDARDIWRFDGGTFTPIGDQRIKNYFYANLNNNYTNQIYMIHNSAKYQIELYYPDLTSTGTCNQMIAYRYDLDVWQPPRQVQQATMATEAPRIIVANALSTNSIAIMPDGISPITGQYTGQEGNVNPPFVPGQTFNNVTQTYTSGSGTGATFKVVLNNVGVARSIPYYNNATVTVINGGQGYQVGDYIQIDSHQLGALIPSQTYDLLLQVTQVGDTVNLATRGVIYSTYKTNEYLVQKDIGANFLGSPITSLFQRNNISYGQPYSASVLVHRVLPESYGTGNLQITIGGNNSVGSAPTFQSTQTVPIQTDNPWVQIDQNEYRVITMKIGNTSSTDSWQCSAANWQVTVVQDTR